MKKLFQSLANGATTLEEVSPPVAGQGDVVIRSLCSLVSSGTERMLVDFGKASLVGKARQQPERVREVLDKVSTDGLASTYKAVRSKLDKPIPLGYSNVGIVTSVGSGVTDLSPGDRVVSNGSHAEVVRVPKNLCAKIPDNVSSKSAAFTVVASIGLQGIRLADPKLGETVVVFGAGLIGLLVVQLLRAQGCKVLAIDLDPEKLKQAEVFGAETCDSNSNDPVATAIRFSKSEGVDAVIIAAATDSDVLISQAANMCRKRGKIVLVGDTGLQLKRADFYEKELTFQVSCSYGPGRYDKNYEEAGHDYPRGFVRWTEKRNFEAVLELMSAGSLQPETLITEEYPFDQAAQAYDRLTTDKHCLGLILEYAENADMSDTIPLRHQHKVERNGKAPEVALVGLGNYASSILVPALASAGAELHTVVSNSGSSGRVKGSGFRYQSNSFDDILSSVEIQLVAIATRHDSHASYIVESLQAGKHVFVEKPLCLNLDELDRVEKAYAEAGSILMVGYNRRFAPLVRQMKEALDTISSPKAMSYTVNAGEIPADHWSQDLLQGGGRIIGEACHFIDLMRYLADSQILNANIEYMDSESRDTAVITLKFRDGSVANINYFANGNKKLPKERLEVFCAGRVIQLDNFRTLSFTGWPGLRKRYRSSQDKGQNQCMRELIGSLTEGGASPIDADEIFEVARFAVQLGRHSSR